MMAKEKRIDRICEIETVVLQGAHLEEQQEGATTDSQQQVLVPEVLHVLNEVVDDSSETRYARLFSDLYSQ